MLMSTCWFRDRWHRQTTDRNSSILWYVLSSLMVAGGWWGSCTWSWPVVGAALAARWALTERQEAERAGEPVRCFSLPPSSTSSIHPSLLLTPFNDVKTNSDAFDAHLLLNFRAGTELELIGKLQPWIRKCAAPVSVCKVKFPVRRQSLVPSSERVRAVSTVV